MLRGRGKRIEQKRRKRERTRGHGQQCGDGVEVEEGIEEVNGDGNF